MLSDFAWIAMAFGCAGLLIGFGNFRAARRARRERDEIQRAMQAAHDELQALKRQLEESKRRLEEELRAATRRYQELVENPPMPTDAQFVTHLLALETRLSDLVQRLEDARIKSAQPFELVAEEAEKAKHVDRKNRFEEFQERLRTANFQIDGHVQQLLASHDVVIGMVAALRSGHLAARIGHQEIQSIEEVLIALEKEQWPDEIAGGVLHTRTKEFIAQLQLRDRMKELERRQREETRAAHNLAFSRHKMPPLTPWQKFQTLLRSSRGQRDSFDVDPS